MANHEQGKPLSLVVLISGNGSNLQAIIDASTPATCSSAITVSGVISNRPDAFGLKRAEHASIPVAVVDHKQFADRNDFDHELASTIDRFKPDLVVLAGFMRILGHDFVKRYQGRLLNIHPSLLPEFPGLDTHNRAIASGAKEHGVSVHFVTDELDGGPVIMQARVPVFPDDDAETLAARVLEREHNIYPEVIRLYAEERIKLVDGKIMVDGKPLKQPLVYSIENTTDIT